MYIEENLSEKYIFEDFLEIFNDQRKKRFQKLCELL